MREGGPLISSYFRLRTHQVFKMTAEGSHVHATCFKFKPPVRACSRDTWSNWTKSLERVKKPGPTWHALTNPEHDRKACASHTGRHFGKAATAIYCFARQYSISAMTSLTPMAIAPFPACSARRGLWLLFCCATIQHQLGLERGLYIQRAIKPQHFRTDHLHQARRRSHGSL